MKKAKTTILLISSMVILFGTLCQGAVELLVSCEDTGQVLRYDGKTGAFQGVLASGLSRPYGLAYGPGGDLYLCDNGTIKRYDKNSQAFINFASGGREELAFSPDGSLCIREDRAFGFGPDGNLYVAGNDIVRYNGVTGEFMDEFVVAGSGGLSGALDLVFGPDNNLYVSNRYGPNILQFNGTDGQFMGVFASDGLEYHPWGITFGPDGNLYVASHYQFSILRYNGVTGNLIDQFVLPGSGGLNSPSHIIFTPIPEPCTLLLLGVGGMMVRKNSKKNCLPRHI